MKEISLNILDIAKNSTKAGATLTQITIDETENTLTLIIEDNGCGMTEEQVKSVCDPFFTSRTTRKVGMGIPLLKLSAEQTEGSFEIVSKAQSEHPEDHGTKVTAVFNKNHIDYTPLGDVVFSVTTLIQGDPDKDFLYIHRTSNGEVTLDTRELRRELGEDIPLSTYEVIVWIGEYLKEQYETINYNS
ncbi:MAG: ATP-binding protein [Ruminococcaceae bacterium]|nr:ATP-binding protein [Oscillospiraceae bacterium]